MEKSLSDYVIWNIDPTLVHFGSHGIRYYGLVFALGIMLGYYFWRKQMARGGHSPEVADRWLVWGIVAVLVGSRLGHCLFYEPEYYLKHPLKILEIWKGGLASHGATLGLIAAIILYARRYGFSIIEMMDRMAIPTTMATITVRIGNFMNGEIVGKEWWGPWAVRFQKYVEINQSLYQGSHGPTSWVAQALPRHPSQLYEALGGFIVFLVLYITDRKLKEKRPRGLLIGMFFLGYFSFRFLVEFFKEFQSLGKLKHEVIEQGINVLRVEPTSGFTMGQYLSIPFALLGVGMIIWALKTRLPASVPSTKAVAQVKGKAGKGRK